MRVTNAKTMWPEKEGFHLERKNIGNQYILLHFHNSVNIHTADGYVETKGTTFIILNKYSYQYFEVIGDHLIHDWIHIMGNLDSIMKESNLEYNKIYNITNSNYVTKITHDIEVELSNHDEYSDGIIKGNLEKLILLLGRSVNSTTDITESETRNIILSARSTIHRLYFQEWDIPEMANLVHMSKSRFCELYTQVIGIPPKKDLQNVRIEHAKFMLITTKMSIRAISREIGYDSEYYFIRKFKALTGMSPGEYRKTANEIDEKHQSYFFD